METPLEIAFHNMTPSESVEAEIRKRVDKLERIYDRLIGCRVSVEAPHKQHRTGNIYEVHIEMRVPRGPELVVTHEPHHAKERYANPDLRASLRDAFKVAETKLKAYKEQLRGDVKRHDSQFQGQVAQLVPGQDFGFITTKEGAQLYFHRNSLMGGDFDKLKPGEVIHYVEEMGDTGPTASKVWVGPDERPD